MIDQQLDDTAATGGVAGVNRFVSKSAAPRLSWNHYIVTGCPYTIMPRSLLISFDTVVHTFSVAGA